LHCYRRPRRREGGSGGGDSDDDGGDGRHTLDERDFVRVSHRDHVVRLAGKIAWNARRDQHMPLLASGPPALATALGVCGLFFVIHDIMNMHYHYQD
jgi:hypothetical protein